MYLIWKCPRWTREWSIPVSTLRKTNERQEKNGAHHVSKANPGHPIFIEAINIWALDPIDTITSMESPIFSYFGTALPGVDISEATVKLNSSHKSSYSAGIWISTWTGWAALYILFLPSGPFLCIFSGLYSSPFCVWGKQVLLFS